MQAKPAIAQLSLTEAWGGLEMTALRFAAFFKEQGWRSYSICPPNSPTAKAAAEAGLQVIPIPQGKRLAPRSSLALRRHLREQKIEIILSHQLRDLWVLWPALWGMPETKVLGVAHMFLRNVNKKDFLHRKIYGRLCGMLALNQAQLKGLKACLPVSSEKYSIVPNGVDIEKFHPRKRSDEVRRALFGLGPNDRAIGVLGRIDPQKGQLEFLQAAAQVHREFPRAKFIVVGHETTAQQRYLPQLEALVDREGLSQVVKFLGHRKDTPEILAALDVFVLPSYEEAFGLVTIEAMASGCAVIGTQSGGTPEIIIDGECGTLVPPRTSEPLGRAIAKYLGDPQLARLHAQAARERAVRVYDQHLVLAKVEALVTSCLRS